MANNSAIISEIRNTIKQNGVGAIKGNDLQQVLVDMVQAVGQGRAFAGIATPSGTPSTYDRNVFWLATAAGTYTNFGGLVIPEGLSVILYNEVEGVGSYSFNTLIEIDDEPTRDSGNLVSSGAIYTAIQTAIQAVEQGATEIYDVSSNHSGASYSTLAAALALVPQVLQKGGISVKYIDSTSGKYVQYRLTTSTWSTTASDWEKAFSQKEVTESRPVESTYNLLDIHDLQSINGVTINEDEAVFTLSSISNKQITFDAEENEVYTLYAEGYCEGNQGTNGSALDIRIYHTDGTYEHAYFQNNVSAFVAKSVSSSFGKTVDYIKLTYGTNGSNIFHLRNLMVTKGTEVKPYTPKICSVDYPARGSFSTLNKQAIKESDIVGLLGQNLANPEWITVDSLIDSNGNFANSSGWNMISIPVVEGQVITFGNYVCGRNAYGAFYNEYGIVGNKLSYSDSDLSAGLTVTVPSGATVLHLDIKTTSSSTSDYARMMINYGDTLLPYVAFEKHLESLKGYKISIFANKKTLDKFDEENGELLWDDNLIITSNNIKKIKEIYGIISALLAQGLNNLVGDVVVGYIDSNGVFVPPTTSTFYRTSGNIDVIYGHTYIHTKSGYTTSAAALAEYNNNDECVGVVVQGSVSDVGFFKYTPSSADVSYVRVSVNTSTIDCLALIDITDSIYALKEDIEDAIYSNDLTLTRVSNNLADKNNIKGGLVNSTGGLQNVAPISSSDTWRFIMIPLSGEDAGKKVTFGGYYLGRSGYTAFYNGDTLVSFHQSSDPGGTQSPNTLTIPDGCDRMYIDIMSGNSPYSLEANYTYLMVNFGDSLLTYDAFKQGVSKIKGIDLVSEILETEIENLEQVVENIDGRVTSLVIADLPVSDGTGIESGYAYIDSSDRTIKVKA